MTHHDDEREHDGDPITDFDQTNGQVEGLQGDSDGFAEELQDDPRDARADGGTDGTVLPPPRSN